mmetsp:Transcript_21480/g.63531  ORF Transcript_21480/g.63531 Transcript_21480/m.63531 type:complete len:202 (-) Transcript_21480:55-660(-)
MEGVDAIGLEVEPLERREGAEGHGFEEDADAYGGHARGRDVERGEAAEAHRRLRDRLRARVAEGVVLQLERLEATAELESVPQQRRRVGPPAHLVKVELDDAAEDGLGDAPLQLNDGVDVGLIGEVHPSHALRKRDGRHGRLALRVPKLREEAGGGVVLLQRELVEGSQALERLPRAERARVVEGARPLGDHGPVNAHEDG